MKPPFWDRDMFDWTGAKAEARQRRLEEEKKAREEQRRREPTAADFYELAISIRAYLRALFWVPLLAGLIWALIMLTGCDKAGKESAPALPAVGWTQTLVQDGWLCSADMTSANGGTFSALCCTGIFSLMNCCITSNTHPTACDCSPRMVPSDVDMVCGP